MEEIKVGVDDLVKESQAIGRVANQTALRNSEVKMIVESYERCCSKLEELKEKSQTRSKSLKLNGKAVAFCLFNFDVI